MSKIASLRKMLERNTAEVAKLSERLSQRDARIAELERLLSGLPPFGQAPGGSVLQGRPEGGAGTSRTTKR